jgi:hypothetical protein
MKWDVVRAAVVRSPRSPRSTHEHVAPKPLRQCGLPSRLQHLHVLHPEAFRRLQRDDDEAQLPASARARVRLRPAPGEATAPVRGSPPAPPPVGPDTTPHRRGAVVTPALRPHRRRARSSHSPTADGLTARPYSPCTRPRATNSQRSRSQRPTWRLPATRLVHSGRHDSPTLSAACASPASSHCPSPRRCRSRGASADSATSSCRIPQPGAAPPPSPEPARDRCQASSHTGTAFLRRGRSRVTGAAACTSLPLRQRPAPAAPANTAEQRPPLLPRKLRMERNPPHSGERKGPGQEHNQNREQTPHLQHTLLQPPDNAPAIIRPAVDTQPASQPRAHPRPSASSPSPSPFYLVAPASVPAVTHSRAHARSWCQRHSHCSSHLGAVYAQAGGRGGGQWTLRYPPRRLPPQPDAPLLRLGAKTLWKFSQAAFCDGRAE